MENNGNHRNRDEDVDERAGDMDHEEPQQPQNQQIAAIASRIGDPFSQQTDVVRGHS